MNNRVWWLAIFSLACLLASNTPFPLPVYAWQAGEKFPSIAAAIDGLGSDEFATRQEASEFLWRAGPAALQELERAARSDDPEVRLRANLVLRKVRLGITFDSPPEVQALVTRYYEGDQNARQQVINELRLQGAFKTLFTFLQSEKNAERRDLFLTTLQADVQRLAPLMEAKGDWWPLEQWLATSQNTDVGLAQLSTFAVLRKNLPATISAAEAELAMDKQNALLVRRVAHLHRAGGKPEQAIKAISAGPIDPAYAAAIFREERRWDDMQAQLAKVTSKNTREMLFERATRAALHRLRGEEDQATSVLKALSDQAQTEDCWYGAKALLLNERPREAIELLRDGLQPLAFEVLVQRQEHQAALELANIQDDTRFDAAWLNGLTGQKGVRTSRSVDRFTYATTIAAELRMLGKHRQFDELHKLLRETAEVDDQRGQNWLQLARLERQAGRHKQALAHYSRAIARNPTPVWAQLFGKKTARAQLWWDAFEGEARWLDPVARIEAVALAMQPTLYARHVSVEWPEIARQVTAKATNPATLPSQRARLHVALAEAWSARGDKPRAEENWKAAVAADPSTSADYADALLADNRWSEAAARYKAALTENEGHTHAMFLQGLALTRAGKQVEGTKLQATANLMALDATARYSLANALVDRNLREVAREHWQLLKQTGMPDHSFVMGAYQQLGNDLAEEQPLVAADHWEQLRFHLLKPAISLAEQNGYLELTVAIHRTRARGLLAKGEQAAAIAELRRCEDLLPGNIKLVEDFVSKFRQLKLDREADELFERSYQVYERAIKQFPESASLHNQAAWVAALAERKLDEALRLAQRATELNPESAAYADTLAEVYFARGDRPAALNWARKAAMLSSEDKQYEERLKSFATRELPASDKKN